MAALTIAAANVSLVSGQPLADQPAGEAFIAGALVYQADNGTWLKAQCDGTAVEAGANALGIALATADAAGARVSIAAPGCVVGIGAGAAGIVYCPGRTTGTLVPTADLLATDKVSPAAIGIGSSRLMLVRAYNAGAVL
jgi:hypothetical protein